MAAVVLLKKDGFVPFFETNFIRLVLKAVGF